MISNAINKLINRLNNSPYVIWAKNEIKEAKVIQALLVMTVMGWLPFAWTYLLPIMTVYAVVKRKELLGYLNYTLQSVIDFFEGSQEEQLEARENGDYRKSHLSFHIGQWIGKKLYGSPLTVFKHFLSFYILIMSTMPWSMFMIYALYRPQAEVLEAIYKQFKVATDVFWGFYKGLSNVQKVLMTLLSVSITSGLLRSLFVSSGLLGIFDVGMTIGMLGLTVAGFRLVMTDFARAISHPLKLITHKMGIFLGIIGGNRVAHARYYGKLAGSLGPTYGSVESGGFFQSVYKMFFSTNPYGHNQFYMTNSFGANIFNRMSTGAGGLLGSIFFSYDVSTYGTFNGILGPTSYQVFVFMALGAGVGYFIDKAVDRISTVFYNDVNKVWANPEGPSHSKFIEAIKSTVNFGNNYRFPLSATLVTTGLLYGFKTPMYLTILHRTTNPLLSLLLIEFSLLLPALLSTKLYRVGSQWIQNKFFEKKSEVLPEVVIAPTLPELATIQPEIDATLQANTNPSLSNAEPSMPNVNEVVITTEEHRSITKAVLKAAPVVFSSSAIQVTTQTTILEEHVQEEVVPPSSLPELDNEVEEVERGRSRSREASPSRSPSRSRSASPGF